MSAPRPGDRAKVTVLVAVPPPRAFAVFTTDIDAWWRRGPKYRAGGVMRFEPGVGGRLVEEVGGRDFVIGRVTAWEPPSRLVLAWRARNFAPDEWTEVEVRFEAAATGGTRVTVEHRGWASLRDGHPARHGLEGAAFSAMIGAWWGEVMTAFRGEMKGRAE